jgi:hypothetical protein
MRSLRKAEYSILLKSASLWRPEVGFLLQHEAVLRELSVSQPSDRFRIDSTLFLVINRADRLVQRSIRPIAGFRYFVSHF